AILVQTLLQPVEAFQIQAAFQMAARPIFKKQAHPIDDSLNAKMIGWEDLGIRIGECNPDVRGR
ncbi:hypothetical protein DWA20_21745, partial [Acinetobacter baumannii]|uniref:hypothetical protein n=1 Tax=Acinetobacter baumannii TaxID=470 RepID=UPI000E116F68